MSTAKFRICSHFFFAAQRTTLPATFCFDDLHCAALHTALITDLMAWQRDTRWGATSTASALLGGSGRNATIFTFYSSTDSYNQIK